MHTDADTPERPEAGTTITDSFHWYFDESLGVIVLGALVFYLLGKLINCYEQRLRAATGGEAS